MATSMRTAFIRIYTKNSINDGKNVYIYTEKMVNELITGWDSVTEYWYIKHKSDIDDKKIHYHIVLRFKNPVPKNNIIAKFPYSNIQSARSIKSCVQYLIHLNDSDKIQYSWDDINTNCSNMNKYKVTSTSTDEITLIDIMTKIDTGDIREFNQFDKIPIELWAKYKTRIENGLTYFREKKMLDKDRKIQVIFMEGSTGTGKTSFAKDYCLKTGKSFCISSSSNDPMQDYKGEDVLILDDLRDNSFKFVDLLKILDNHTKSTVKSRYHNKAFIGDLIIITSYKPLNNWYLDVPSDARLQLFRRVQTLYNFDYDNISIYCYNQIDLNYTYQGCIKNKYSKQVTAVNSFGLDILSNMGYELEEPDKSNDKIEFKQIEVFDKLPFD